MTYTLLQRRIIEVIFTTVKAAALVGLICPIAAPFCWPLLQTFIGSAVVFTFMLLCCKDSQKKLKAEPAGFHPLWYFYQRWLFAGTLAAMGHPVWATLWIVQSTVWDSLSEKDDEPALQDQEASAILNTKQS